MHLTTTNPVSGVWHQNTRAGVIPAISFTRRNARIYAHAMRMRAYACMRCECAHFRAYDANARICAHFAHAMRMLVHARISPHAMRCDANARMRCDANARIKGELMRVRYCIEEVPYCFSRSCIKFKGYIGKKFNDFNTILGKITRPVAAMKSLRFALFLWNRFFWS